jgi:hypothetical protein
VSKIITEWHADRVIEAVTEEVTANLEIAAKMVETDAKRRLLSIKTPDWGRGYRKLIALYRLTSFVEVGWKTIEAGIGVPPDPRSGTEMMGFYIETGSKTASAHPWLRPALFHNLGNIVDLLGGK